MSRRRPKPAGRAARQATNSALDLRHEDARTRAMLDGLQEEILRMAPEAVANASTHVLFAGDPRAEFLTSDLDAARLERLATALGTEPVVGFLPADVAEGLIERFMEIEPAASGMLRSFRQPVAPQSFRLLTICGRAMGLKVLTVGVREPELVNGLPIVMTESDARQAPGKDEMLLSPLGIIKWVLSIDANDCQKETRRRQIVRLQERARAIWAAEAIRSQPRGFDDVIAAEFKADRLRAAMNRAAATGDGGLLDRALDALFGSCEVVS